MACVFENFREFGVDFRIILCHSSHNLFIHVPSIDERPNHHTLNAERLPLAVVREGVGRHSAGERVERRWQMSGNLRARFASIRGDGGEGSA